MNTGPTAVGVTTVIIPPLGFRFTMTEAFIAGKNTVPAESIEMYF